jgi:hypothetical protein
MVEVVNTARRCLCWFAVLTGLAAFPSAVLSHVLDEYLQATLVTIRPDEALLRINLTPGVAVADEVIALMDTNHDGVISTNEAAGYGEVLKRDLKVSVDGRTVDLTVGKVDFPEPSELRTGLGIVQIELRAKLDPLGNGRHRITVENGHLPKLSVYLVNAAQPETSAVQIVAQKRNLNQSVGEIEFVVHQEVNALGTFGVVSLGALGGVFLVGIWRAARKPVNVG